MVNAHPDVQMVAYDDMGRLLCGPVYRDVEDMISSERLEDGCDLDTVTATRAHDACITVCSNYFQRLLDLPCALFFQAPLTAIGKD